MSLHPSLFQKDLHYSQWTFSQIHLDWITHIEREKNFRFPPEFCPHYIATWVQKGKSVKRMGKQVLNAQADEWIFQHPGRISTVYPVDTHYYQIAFTIRWIGEDPLLYPPQETLWKTGPLPELENATVQLHQFAQNGFHARNAEIYAMRTTPTSMSLFLQLRYHFDRWLIHWQEACAQHNITWTPIPQTEKSVSLVARQLEELPLDKPISVREIARGTGLSTRHLTHLFSQHYGLAPKAYRMQLKLKEAIQLLQTTDHEIKEIAHRLGCSHVWLSTWLKKQTGKTPTDIRKEGKGSGQGGLGQ